MGTTSRHSPHLRRRLDPPRSSGWRLLAEAGGRWRRHAPEAGAALAFHASGALGCGLLAAVALLALMQGPDSAAAFAELAGAVGHPAASGLQSLLAMPGPHAAIAAGISVLGLLAAGAAAFAQLRRGLNAVHDGTRLPTIPAADLAQTLGGFAMVLVAGGLVLVSLCLGLALSLFAAVHATGSGTLRALVLVADAGLSSMLLLPAAALLLRWLPVRPPSPLAAWKGALVAGLPAVLGKLLLAGWIAGAGIATAYGAAGAVLLTMLWLYASSQLLMLGAAVTAGADDDADELRARHLGARPLRAPPERVAANTPLPAAPPTSLAAARSRLRPAVAHGPSADDRRRGPGVLLQFPAARRRHGASSVPPS